VSILDFETWMERVDEVVNRIAGCSYQDLPDCPYRDWYDDGMKPEVAARRAVRNAEE
jgi:hypothetical protein